MSNNRTPLKTALIALLVVIGAYLIYGFYLRSRVQEERLQQDTRLIEGMLKENNPARP